MNETILVLQASQELSEEEINQRKLDLKKIKKFLIRQTHNENLDADPEKMNKLKTLSFWDFLYEVGMFSKDKPICGFSTTEKEDAKRKYLNALSVSVSGKACVILKRKVEDIFVNGYSKVIMNLHNANHDVQIVVDPYIYCRSVHIGICN